MSDGVDRLAEIQARLNSPAWSRVSTRGQRVIFNEVLDIVERMTVEHANLLSAAEARLETLRRQVEAVRVAAVVAHKGPHETDADRLLTVADRLDRGYEIGGFNTRAAVARLLRVVAESLATAVPGKPQPTQGDQR